MKDAVQIALAVQRAVMYDNVSEGSRALEEALRGVNQVRLEAALIGMAKARADMEDEVLSLQRVLDVFTDWLGMYEPHDELTVKNVVQNLDRICDQMGVAR